MNNESKKPTYNARPMTIYVSRNGVSNIDPAHYGVEAERTIDIELTEYDAIELRDMLVGKLSVEVYGSVTFRLRGRLIL